MKAIIARAAGGPDVLVLDDVETPQPQPGEVLIEVHAAGVNRADLIQRQGHYPPPPGASPLIGLECSGRIAEVGDDVTGWQVGEECVALLAGGGYAEYVAVPAGQVIDPPPGLDLLTAAGVMEVAATVVSNLQLARLRSGERFLVHGGSGGIGSFAIQYAKAIGAEVLTTAGTQDKLAYCRSLGADGALSYHDDWVEGLLDATDRCGVEVILDNMGASYLTPNVSALAVGGRLMIIGLQGGRKGEVDLGQLLAKRGQLMATSLRARPTAEKTEICRTVADEVWPLIAAGQVKPAPHTTFALARAEAAHRQLESGDNLGKIILTVAEG